MSFLFTNEFIKDVTNNGDNDVVRWIITSSLL